MLDTLDILIHLKDSTPSNGAQAKSIQSTLYKSRGQSVGTQPNAKQNPPDLDGFFPPFGVSKALADSKPLRKESLRTLRCPLGSESVLIHQV
jgi:hypothetical protein